MSYHIKKRVFVLIGFLLVVGHGSQAFSMGHLKHRDDSVCMIGGLLSFKLNNSHLIPEDSINAGEDILASNEGLPEVIITPCDAVTPYADWALQGGFEEVLNSAVPARSGLQIVQEIASLVEEYKGELQKMFFEPAVLSPIQKIFPGKSSEVKERNDRLRLENSSKFKNIRGKLLFVLMRIHNDLCGRLCELYLGDMSSENYSAYEKGIVLFGDLRCMSRRLATLFDDKKFKGESEVKPHPVAKPYHFIE